jgi:hypothetical protein
VSNGPRRRSNARPAHDRLYVARVRRTELGDSGEHVVALELLRDGDVAELADGDEFVTVYLSVDPFLPPSKVGPD